MPLLQDKKFTKQAFGPLSLLLPASMHVGQNVALDRALRKDSVGKLIAGRLRDGFEGTARGTSVGNRGEAAFGAADAVLPEIGMLGDGAKWIGRRFAEKLKAEGIDPQKMTKRQWAALHRAMEGKFDRAYKISRRDPDIRKALGEGLDSLLPPKILPEHKQRLGKLISEHTDEAWKTVGPSMMEDLNKVYRENPLTNHLGRNVAKHLRSSKVTTPVTGLKPGLRRTLDVATNVGVAALDPTSAGVNLGKRALMSSKLRDKVPWVGMVQDRMNDIFTTGPIKSMYEAGLQGKGPRFPNARRIVTTYGLNPVTGAAESLANSAGKLVGKYEPFLRQQGYQAHTTAIKKLPWQIASKIPNPHTLVQGLKSKALNFIR